MSSITSLSQIPSNYHCHRKIYKLVWGDYTCPHCNKSGLIFRSSYEWCPHCRKKHSVKATTFFRYSKLTYKDIYILIWCWQHKWTVSEIRKATGLSYLTIKRVHRVLVFSHEELTLILKEWEMRHNRPDLFYNVDNYLLPVLVCYTKPTPVFSPFFCDLLFDIFLVIF